MSPDATILPPKAATSRDTILAWIRKGKLQPGDKLPSEVALARQLKMNNHSVRRGLAELKKNGVIVNRPRIGNFVNEVQPRELLKHIALVVPDHMLNLASSTRPHPIAQALHRQAMQAFDQRRYSPITYGYTYSEQLRSEVAPLVAERSIQGVVLMGTSVTTAEDVQPLLDTGVSLVVYPALPALKRLGLTCIDYDNELTYCQIAHGLAERGHRRIVWGCYLNRLKHLAKPTDRAHREQAVRSAVVEAGLQPGRDVQIVRVYNPLAGLDFSDLFAALETDPRPTAVVAPDEYVAAMLFRYCYERHIRIPDDLSIVSEVDNAPEMHAVPLTAPDTLALHEEIAGSLVTSLRQEMQGGETTRRTIICSSSIQWKQSVASVKSPV